MMLAWTNMGAVEVRETIKLQIYFEGNAERICYKIEYVVKGREDWGFLTKKWEIELSFPDMENISEKAILR